MSYIFGKIQNFARHILPCNIYNPIISNFIVITLYNQLKRAIMIAVYNRDIWSPNYVNLFRNNSFFFKNLKFEYREILEDTAIQIANSYQEKHLHERITTSDVLLFFSTTILLRFFACSHWSSCSALGGRLFFFSGNTRRDELKLDQKKRGESWGDGPGNASRGPIDSLLFLLESTRWPRRWWARCCI